jgi:hypothetical protein
MNEITTKKELFEILPILEKYGRVKIVSERKGIDTFLSVENEMGKVSIYYRWSPIMKKNGEPAKMKIEKEYITDLKFKNICDIWIENLKKEGI